MSQPRIVALCGGKSHGKSTAAKVLIDAGYIPVNFADRLKKACAIIFDLTDEEMEDEVIKEQVLDRWPFLSPRAIMQHVGTELFRNWLPETWTNGYAIDVARVLASGADVVTGDLRFPDNEVETIRAAVPDPRETLILRVVNPRKALGRDPHPSEVKSAQIVVDDTLTNDKGIDDLRAAVAALVLGR